MPPMFLGAPDMEIRRLVNTSVLIGGFAVPSAGKNGALCRVTIR
jgi:hypothetical protein